MPRLIDADALKEDIEQQCALLRLMKDNDELNQISTVLESGFMAQIDKMPTIEERKKGKWKEEVDTGERMLACSACGGRVFLEPFETAVGEHGYRFCPYCGARMER